MGNRGIGPLFTAGYKMGHKRGLEEALVLAEQLVDAANGFPCLFCKADTYDGSEGIVHQRAGLHVEPCLMLVLRDALAHVREHDCLPDEGAA